MPERHSVSASSTDNKTHEISEPRSFTVEVKHRRSSRSQDLQPISPIPLEADNRRDRDQAADPVSHAAELAFGGPDGCQEVAVLAPAQEMTLGVPERRILPDLTSEDPFQALLRKEAEKRASLDGRRGPRKKRADVIGGQDHRVDGRKLVKKAQSRARQGDADRAVRAAVPAVEKPAVAASIRVRRERSRPGKAAATRQQGRWIRRRPQRLPRHAEVLRPGERWKRRLPPVCC